MCGIFGYVGKESVVHTLIQGLQKLEYRGYDSAGIAVALPGGKIEVVKQVGNVDELAQSLGEQLPEAKMGIGHTRWATHGAVTEVNAHPHRDCTGTLAVVHNGIVENFADLRRSLKQGGHKLVSDTDSEVIVHLLEEQMKQGMTLEKGVMQLGKLLQGSNVILVLSTACETSMAALKLGYAGGMLVGYGDGQIFLSSDLPALPPEAEKVVFLEDGEAVVVEGSGEEPQVRFHNSFLEEPIDKPAVDILGHPWVALMGQYQHFMLKEIMEQPQVLVDSLQGRVDLNSGRVDLGCELRLTDEELSSLNRVVLTGCGTSYHAALVGKGYIESLVGLPAEAEPASELRYRTPHWDERTLVIAIGQSGETADTLGAMVEAKNNGARVMSICNVFGSQATRIADATLHMRAGPEVAVCSTKTFLGSLSCLYLLGLELGRRRGWLSRDAVRKGSLALTLLPGQLNSLLAQRERVRGIAEDWAGSPYFLYLGRGLQYPLALEGALKMKEVSYLHAEGYPAGEMKHGPIALVEQGTKVVALMARDSLYSKMTGNVSEVVARGGDVLVLASEGEESLPQGIQDCLLLPQTLPDLTPLLLAIPLQLLAYHAALAQGCDIDRPRNLAKSVTVE